MIDEALMNDLDLKGENVKLSLAGINATEDRKCLKSVATIESLENNSAMNVTLYSHKDLKVGNQSVDVKQLKRDHPKMYKDVRSENYNLQDVKVVLGQDYHRLHHAYETAFTVLKTYQW